MSERVASALTITRRAALGATLAAGAGWLLWPHTRPGANAPRGRVELQYWEKWTGIEGAALQKVVDRFNGSQDRIWVHLVPVSDITSKAMVAIGGGDPPDIVGLYSYSVPGYAEARAVMPLDDFKHLGPVGESRYVAGVLELLTHDGKQWAGVNTCYTLALYYNRAMLRAAGHDPDRPPRTILELDALSDALTKRDASGARLETAGLLQNVPGWWNYIWPFMFGGSLYDPAADTALIGSPQCIAAFEWLRATAQRYGVNATTAFASGYGRNIHSAQDPFISGRMGMIVQGPWLANFIHTFGPELDYAATPMPVAEGLLDPERPVGLLEADILVIPRGCPHPEESYRFLQFMQRRDVQEELALAHCKPSPLVDMSPGFLEHHPNRAIRTFDAVAKSPRAQVLPRTTAWKQYSDLINASFDAVWLGADPHAKLADVQSRAQQLIDLARTRKAQRRSLTSLQAAPGGAA